jgi:hypothetical protein
LYFELSLTKLELSVLEPKLSPTFAAYDLSTGNSLTFTTSSATSVQFPTYESDGYQFRVQFLLRG